MEFLNLQLMFLLIFNMLFLIISFDLDSLILVTHIKTFSVSYVLTTVQEFFVIHNSTYSMPYTLLTYNVTCGTCKPNLIL
jgi:hypothetical protein